MNTMSNRRKTALLFVRDVGILVTLTAITAVLLYVFMLNPELLLDDMEDLGASEVDGRYRLDSESPVLRTMAILRECDIDLGLPRSLRPLALSTMAELEQRVEAGEYIDPESNSSVVPELYCLYELTGQWEKALELFDTVLTDERADDTAMILADGLYEITELESKVPPIRRTFVSLVNRLEHHVKRNFMADLFIGGLVLVLLSMCSSRGPFLWMLSPDSNAHLQVRPLERYSRYTLAIVGLTVLLVSIFSKVYPG